MLSATMSVRIWKHACNYVNNTVKGVLQRNAYTSIKRPLRCTAVRYTVHIFCMFYWLTQ
jgi:hypothetical protein